MTEQTKQNNPLKIKVCGMRNKENIEALVKLPIDYIGFIFYPQSPRYIGSYIPSDVLNLIPQTIKKTGVFVNATLNEVLRCAEENELDCIQLHGGETPDYCNTLREKGYKIIKAFKADLEVLTCETAEYRYASDYFLFDTPTQLHGGSGQKFNWEILKQQVLPVPFFLSGGISPEDYNTINSLNINNLYAIDINSKFEVSPGIKDIDKIATFIKNIK